MYAARRPRGELRLRAGPPMFDEMAPLEVRILYSFFKSSQNTLFF